MVASRKAQLGFELSKLILWGILLGVGAVLGMKAVPSFLMFQAVDKAAKEIASQSNQQTTVAEVKGKFGKYMEVNSIKFSTEEGLDIYKESNLIVIDYAFQDKIKLFGPVSLVIDYKGSTKAVSAE